MLERRAFLHQVVFQESKAVALGKDGSLVMQRAIFKVEHKVVGYGITVRDLGQVTLCESIPLECSKRKKAMHKSFGVAHANFFGSERRRTGQYASDHCKQ